MARSPKDEAIEDLLALNDELKATIGRLKRARNRYMDQAGKLEDGLERLEAENKRLREQSVDIFNGYTSADESRLRKENIQLRAENDRLRRIFDLAQAYCNHDWNDSGAVDAAWDALCNAVLYHKGGE